MRLSIHFVRDLLNVEFNVRNKIGKDVSSSFLITYLFMFGLFSNVVVVSFTATHTVRLFRSL